MQAVSIVAILNVTPDSFVDGGKWQTLEHIVARALQCRDQGADIVEIGGESSGPGSSDLSADEECSRVIPAIEAIRRADPLITVAVDTYRSETAKRAVAAGASMINDILAGRGDPQMFATIAQLQCAYVMMFAKDSTARTTKRGQHYDDVITTIHDFLTDRHRIAIAAGIDPRRIIVDPGLGHFVSAIPEYSWQILCSLQRFADLGPVFVSPSRKSFLAGPENLPVSERLPATLHATRIAIEHGASYIRTHDVRETKECVEAIHSAHASHR